MDFQLIALNKGSLLGKLWLASTFDKKLRKEDFEIKIKVAVGAILANELEIPLRFAGSFLFGATRIFGKKTKACEQEVDDLLGRLRAAIIAEKKNTRIVAAGEKNIGDQLALEQDYVNDANFMHEKKHKTRHRDLPVSNTIMNEGLGDFLQEVLVSNSVTKTPLMMEGQRLVEATPSTIEVRRGERTEKINNTMSEQPLEFAASVYDPLKTCFNFESSDKKNKDNRALDFDFDIAVGLSPDMVVDADMDEDMAEPLEPLCNMVEQTPVPSGLETPFDELQDTVPQEAADFCADGETQETANFCAEETHEQSSPFEAPEDLMDDYVQSNQREENKQKRQVLREQKNIIENKFQNIVDNFFDEDRTTIVASLMKQNMESVDDITIDYFIYNNHDFENSNQNNQKKNNDVFIGRKINNILGGISKDELRDIPQDFPQDAPQDVIIAQNDENDEAMESEEDEPSGYPEAMDDGVEPFVNQFSETVSETAILNDFEGVSLAPPSPDEINTMGMSSSTDDLRKELSNNAFKTLCWLRGNFRKKNRESISFHELANSPHKFERLIVANIFFELLGLKTKGLIDLQQNGGDVTITATAKFFCENDVVVLENI